jgi:hypothetical protein
MSVVTKFLVSFSIVRTPLSHIICLYGVKLILVKRRIVGQGLDDPQGLGSLLFIMSQTGLQTYYRWSPIRTYTES